ncbi:gliding motility-associated ABC transporter ATP-binding subunit GldA [Halocola ammonii]
MSISAKNVTKFYGKQKALDNVSFEVSSGEVIGFLGPNGAGKSTMMKIITCFIPQSEGDVKVCGHDVTSNSIEVRKRVGYLPENNPLYLDMYVKEYLHFVGGIYRVPNLKKRVAEMIETVGLQVEQNKRIGELSKGYRQRVGLAQAMIHDPEVLILDEPTSGLDPNQLVEIRKLITEIGKQKTVMLSTHIMQEVEAICNRVIIINKGKIVADQDAEGLTHRFSGNGYTVLVEFSKPVEENQLLQIDGVASAVNVKDNNWTIQTNTEEDIRQRIFDFAVSQENSVLTMNRKEQRLEDVFKELTK